MLLLQGMARWGQTPQNAWNRKAALGGSPRMSAAMEAEMARRLDAFAMPDVSLAGGAAQLTAPPLSDIPIKRL